MPLTIAQVAYMFQEPRPEYRQECQHGQRVLEVSMDEPVAKVARMLKEKEADLVLLVGPEKEPRGLADPREVVKASQGGEPEAPEEFLAGMARKAIDFLTERAERSDKMMRLVGDGSGPLTSSHTPRIYKCRLCQRVVLANPCPYDDSPCDPRFW